MSQNWLYNKKKTQILTKIGFLFLEKMGCHEISTEVLVHSYYFRDFTNPIKNDAHYHIDILGIEWEYLPPNKETHQTNKREILRGIEVKISKSDFKNGFIHNSCNYNYLLIPKELIEQDQIHKSIGIIEVDLDNFKIIRDKPPWYGYHMVGVVVTRSPQRIKINEDELSEMHLRSVKSEMLETLTNQTKRWILDEIGWEYLPKRTITQQ